MRGSPKTKAARAFRGELVPTEAELARREGRDYEPASALLERVGGGRRHGRAAKAKAYRDAKVPLKAEELEQRQRKGM